MGKNDDIYWQQWQKLLEAEEISVELGDRLYEGIRMENPQ